MYGKAQSRMAPCPRAEYLKMGVGKTAWESCLVRDEKLGYSVCEGIPREPTQEGQCVICVCMIRARTLARLHAPKTHPVDEEVKPGLRRIGLIAFKKVHTEYCTPNLSQPIHELQTRRPIKPGEAGEAAGKLGQNTQSAWWTGGRCSRRA